VGDFNFWQNSQCRTIFTLIRQERLFIRALIMSLEIDYAPCTFVRDERNKSIVFKYSQRVALWNTFGKLETRENRLS
jgi:hypothetical protein